MNDLKILRDGWSEPAPPSPDAYQAARAALMQQIAGGGAPRAARPRRRGLRLSWLLGGATTVAAVAALVAAVAFPALPDTAPSQAAAFGPGRDSLLAAAVVAEGQSDSVGTYWHVSTVFHHVEDDLAGNETSTLEYWTTRDGLHYIPSGSGVVRYGVAVAGFEVAGGHLTLAELQQLPTDAAALTAWIADSLDDLHPGWADAYTAGELTRLLWSVPAPRAVRAAAFRALADLSNVTRLADQDGDWVLRIRLEILADKYDGELPEGVGERTVVIDPATSELVSEATYQGTREILLAEWTDDIPPIVESTVQPTEAPPTVTE